MRMKFVVFALLIAVYNILIIYLFNWETQIYVTMALCVAGTVFIALLLFNWIIKPVETLQKKMEEATVENSKAEKIRSEFVANVSHELKTPLTSILGFIETLQDGAAENPEVRRKFLDIIAIETSRLKRLIEDLLVLSDIENKRTNETQNEIHIQQSVQEIISAIHPIAAARDIRIEVDIDEQLSLIGSEDRFKQMMLNLIENAIKYSKERGTVYIFTEIPEENKIALTVKDEGIGIATNHIERLFERFYRVDESRSTKAGGTGLGLSIVKHIAHLFDAELKVESQLNKGSSFTVIFKVK